MPPTLSPEKIFTLERPGPALWRLYIIQAILSGPILIVTLPYLLFRYHTLRYRFDEEGIHRSSGFIQRSLGLADVLVQTLIQQRLRGLKDAGLGDHDDLPLAVAPVVASADTLDALRRVLAEAQALRHATAKQ